MKSYLILILIILYSTLLSAQSIGFYGNVVMANQHKNYFSSTAFVTNHIGIEYYGEKHKLLNYTLNASIENKGFDINDDIGNTISLRLCYLSLKYLGRIGNNKFYAQAGPYVGVALGIEYTSNGIIDEFYYQEMKRIELGTSFSVHQYLFSLKNTTLYLRGETNYAFSNEYVGDFINFNLYNRNFTYGLGLVVRWNYKD